MKNKLLLIPTTTIALIPLCACGPSQTGAEKIAKAIFDPIDKPQMQLVKGFIESFKELSQEEKNNELIYDLFVFANYNDASQTYLDKTIREYYIDGTVGIQTNVTKCELKFNDDDELIANFLGYVSFVFLKDVNESYKTNDYLMVTYDIKDLKVEILDNYFGYYNEDESYCLGFVKVRQEAGSEEHLVPIFELNKYGWEFGDIPHNSQNWIQ